MSELFRLSLLLGVLVVGCEQHSERASEIKVFAASSLKAPLEELARDFERREPSVRVRLNFAGSQILRLQIEEGAPADIFASADRRHMDALVKAGLVAQSRPLGASDLVLITPRDQQSVREFTDLRRAHSIVLGRAGVPIGSYARQVLALAAKEYGRAFEAEALSRVVSMEDNVRLVQAKIELGEADAAFVYRTEANRSDRVRIVEIPSKFNVRAEYEIGLRPSSPSGNRARAFFDSAFSERGRAIFSRAGFQVGAFDEP